MVTCCVSWASDDPPWVGLIIASDIPEAIMALDFDPRSVGLIIASDIQRAIEVTEAKRCGWMAAMNNCLMLPRNV